MSEEHDNNRNFTARIFIKGKCYNFDNKNNEIKIQCINDQKINSPIIIFFQSIKKIFFRTFSFNWTINNYYFNVLIKTFIILCLMSLLAFFSYFFFFK
jgi:hypothetical protein